MISKSVVLLCLPVVAVYSCIDSSECQVLNALRNGNGVCVCPEGRHTEKNACVPDDAGIPAASISSTDASGWGPALSGYKDASSVLERPERPPLLGDGSLMDNAGGERSGAGANDASASHALDAGIERNPSDASSTTCRATPETCDGIDNNCDGRIDEGTKNECGGCGEIPHPRGEICSNGGQGVCSRPGKYECMGETTICNASPPAPTEEICDGVDNDCDGTVDDGVKKNSCNGCAVLAHMPTSGCSEGEGECRVVGSWQCVGTESVDCTAQAGTPVAEQCDGKDNDCDGAIDEDAQKPWYMDCDGDGYWSKEPRLVACNTVPSIPNCRQLSETPPPTGSADCQDRSSNYRPGADFGFASLGSGDLNCDGTEEKEVSTSGEGRVIFTTSDLKLWVYPCASTSSCPCEAVIQDGKPVFAVAFPCSQTPYLLRELDAHCEVVPNGTSYSAGQLCR